MAHKAGVPSAFSSPASQRPSSPLFEPEKGLSMSPDLTSPSKKPRIDSYDSPTDVSSSSTPATHGTTVTPEAGPSTSSPTDHIQGRPGARAGNGSHEDLEDISPALLNDLDLELRNQYDETTGKPFCICPWPNCKKRYGGVNARSVCRRHVANVHNVALAKQPRKSRWDGDRPRTEEERRERTLNSKRKWAQKNRAKKKEEDAQVAVEKAALELASMSSAPRTPSRSQPPGQASQHSRLASVPRTFKPNTFAEDASVNELLAPPPTLGHAPTTTMLPSLQSQTGYGSSSSIDLESPFSLARIAPNSTHSAHQKPPHFQHSVDTFTSPPDSSSPDIDPFKTSRTTQSPDQKPPPDRQAAEVLLAMMSSPEKGVKREDSPEQRL